MIATLILAVLASGASPEQCRRVHYTADGRVIETTVFADADGASASSRSSSSSSGTSSSSVSVGSSSKGGASVASSSSSVDGVTRSTTVRRDADGCTITVDDRSPKE